jgi:hypothetical protein
MLLVFGTLFYYLFLMTQLIIAGKVFPVDLAEVHIDAKKGFVDIDISVWGPGEENGFVLNCLSVRSNEGMQAILNKEIRFNHESDEINDLGESALYWKGKTYFVEEVSILLTNPTSDTITVQVKIAGQKITAEAGGEMKFESA